MQQVALINLVKDVLHSPENRIALQQSDFEAVDLLDPNDQWTIDLDEEGVVWIGFTPKKADA